MRRAWAALLLLACASTCFAEGGGFRLPDDDGTNNSGPAKITSYTKCYVFPVDHVWNSPIDTVHVHVNSASWLNTIFSVAPAGSDPGVFHVNLGGGNGHYVNLSDWVPSTSMKIGSCKDGGEFTGFYPFVYGTTTLQVGDPDHHCLMLDRPRCMLYECYGEDRAAIGAIPDSCCYGYQWDLTGYALPAAGKSTADEAGLCITAGLFTYEEVFIEGAIYHALRFQSQDVNIDTTTSSPLWPAGHTSHPSLASYKVSGSGHAPIPFGARIRLRANFVPSGAAALDPGFLVMTACMKKYGAILADRGSSQIALSGTADSRWGTWPNKFMTYTAQWIPYLDVVDESPYMKCGPQSGRYSP